MSGPASRYERGMMTAHPYSHYDIEINPVVHVQNQKKPKGMIRAIFEQTCLEGIGDWKIGFDACAFDGRKNCFTPIPFPLRPGKWPSNPEIYSFTAPGHVAR